MPRKALSIQTAGHPLRLWVEDNLRDLIDQAAEARGQSRAEFMRAAVRRAAEEALLAHALAAPAGDGAFLFLHEEGAEPFGYAPALPETVPLDEPLQVLVR